MVTKTLIKLLNWLLKDCGTSGTLHASLVYRPRKNMCIEDVIGGMFYLQKKTKVTITCAYNGVKISVSENDKYDDIMAIYQKALDQKALANLPNAIFLSKHDALETHELEDPMDVLYKKSKVPIIVLFKGTFLRRDAEHKFGSLRTQYEKQTKKH